MRRGRMWRSAERISTAGFPVAKDLDMTRYLSSQKEKAKDFKSQIIRYLDAMLQSQQRVIIQPNRVFCSACSNIVKKKKRFNQLRLSWPDFIPAYKILGGVPAWGEGNSLTKREICYYFFLFKTPTAFLNTFASLAGAERTIFATIHFFFSFSF